MLCACSGERERIHFDEVPQSPESLATRDFSVSGLSSRTGEWEAKVDIGQQIDDVESALREGLSLNYEVVSFFLVGLEINDYGLASIHPVSISFHSRKHGHC